MTFTWGDTVERRTSGLPFLCYTPRRTQVVDLLDDAGRWTDRTAMVQAGRRMTFGEMFGRIADVARTLEGSGVRRGDRVMLLAPNSIEWVLAMWAGLRQGAVVTLGNSWWSASEVAHAIDVVEPSLVVGDRARLDLLAPGARRLDLADLRDAPTDGPAPAPPAPPREASEDDPAVIIFTAGTTGFPKAVTLAHRSILANLHNLLVVSGRLPHQIDPDRAPAVNLQSGPLFHIGGFQTLLLSLIGGATLVFLAGRFDPAEVLDLIEEERITVWGAIPTMAARVLDQPSLPWRDLTSVRSISSGGQPVQPQLLERLRRHFPNARRGLSTIYGMTETGGTVASASGALMAEHPTTAGRPLPTAEVCIHEPDHEILVRTPGQLIGYWGRPADDLVDDEGFVHTGDMGRMDDGLLFVTGRIKDLIIRGGENIAPSHVEAALLTHPAVLNVAVVGRPDDDLGERVGAVVQTAEGHPVAPEELAAHVAPLLARFEVPVEWWISTGPLPMTDAGKTDKRALVAAWTAR